MLALVLAAASVAVEEGAGLERRGPDRDADPDEAPEPAPAAPPADGGAPVAWRPERDAGDGERRPFRVRLPLDDPGNDTIDDAAFRARHIALLERERDVEQRLRALRERHAGDAPGAPVEAEEVRLQAEQRKLREEQRALRGLRPRPGGAGLREERERHLEEHRRRKEGGDPGPPEDRLRGPRRDGADAEVRRPERRAPPDEKGLEEERQKFRRLADFQKRKAKNGREGARSGVSLVIGGVVVAGIVALLYAFRRPLLRGFREKKSDALPSAFDTRRAA
jgi:hypothetical protein